MEELHGRWGEANLPNQEVWSDTLIKRRHGQIVVWLEEDALEELIDPLTKTNMLASWFHGHVLYQVENRLEGDFEI